MGPRLASRRSRTRRPRPASCRGSGRARLLTAAIGLLASGLGAISVAPAPAGARVLTGPRFASAPHVFAQHRDSGLKGPASPAIAGATSPAATPGSGPAFGSYSWPVRGPVARPFEPPATPYSSGHRGIDIAVPVGTPIRAPADGTVAFAGSIAGSLFISIDHPDGIRTSYSWISAVGVGLKRGQAVTKGEVIGKTGAGDPGSAQPVLHFGARLNGVYIDPMLLLGGGNLDEVIHLAPRA